MTFKTLTTFLHSESDDDGALDAAIDMARRNDAHLSLVLAGMNTLDPGFYYAGLHTAAITTALNEADDNAKALVERIAKRMESEGISWDDSHHVIHVTGIGPALATVARFGDLTVLPRPYGPGRGQADAMAVEAALLDTGVPVLMVPAGTKTLAQPERVLLGWDGGRPALAAARAALPLLRAAKEVVICVIDPPHHGPERSDPGGALAAFLTRHGARVRINVMSGSGRRVAEIMTDEAAQLEAGLIVMGGYGHSRTRQYVLGGTTRRMLEQSDRPVLMAH